MQAFWGCFLMSLVGCASTVSRLPGAPVPTPVGTAAGACEKESWLVIAPTRSYEPTESGRTTKKRDDGVGLYRVDDRSPESIPALASVLDGPPDMMHRHQEGASSTKSDQIIATVLGATGLVALGVGGYFFATSFETTKTRQPDGSLEEEQKIEGGRIALGSGLIALGFGLGIAGLVTAPSAAERARADQAEYAFVPPEDRRSDVEAMVDKHNRAVRDRCQSGATVK